MSENTLIEKIRAVMRDPRPWRDAGLLGIGDDAALWRPKPSCEAVLSCDWFLEGTHFLRDKHPPESVGWKCLARALSDLAAMGATPSCFLLSLALPESLTGRWLDRFLKGLRRASLKFSCRLVGGDTTGRSEVLVSLTVIGEAVRRSAVLRSGARPGDTVFVSGRLGQAELGLRLIRHSRERPNSKSSALQKHLYPVPRLELGHWLAQKHLVSAMMDLSDGISTDLPRLCAASQVGARIVSRQIPSLSSASVPHSVNATPLELALHGGDDYELLFTVPATKARKIPHRFGELELTPIGTITKKPVLLLVNEAGRELPFSNQGWDPFRIARRRAR